MNIITDDQNRNELRAQIKNYAASERRILARFESMDYATQSRAARTLINIKNQRNALLRRLLKDDREQ